MRPTGWYDVWQRPVRVGYYEGSGDCRRHWWTGRKWQYSKDDTTKLIPFCWRGLTEKAK